MSLVDEHGRPLNPEAPKVIAERPRAPIRVTIGIPARDQVSASFMYDLAAMMTATAFHRKDIELRLFIERSTILTSQRHNIVRYALTSDSTHILWLDSDMRFPKDTLVRLLAHDVDIVAANYVERRVPPRPVAFLTDASVLVRDRLYTLPESTGLIEVASVGMGVMLTKAVVFNQIPLPFFQFGWHTEAQVEIGEDIYFARKAREHGHLVLVDQELSKQVRHVGEIEYKHDHALAVKDELVANGH